MAGKIKTSNVSIGTIKLNVAGTELELTLEEAKELKEVLGKLFPSPVSFPQIIRETVRPPMHWGNPYTPSRPFGTDIVCKLSSSP